MAKTVTDALRELKESLAIGDVASRSAADIITEGSLLQDVPALETYIDRVSSGQSIGYSLHYKNLTSMIGRIEPGQVMVIGGYPGTGKSFFAINLVEGVIGDAEPPRVAVFSTELSRIDYLKRLMLVRSGVHDLAFKKDPKRYAETVRDNLSGIGADTRLEDGTLRVWGNITSVEEIEAILSALQEIDELPKIIVVDWLQQLAVDGKSAEKDLMPVLPSRIHGLCVRFGVAVVCISQMNLSSLNKDFKQEKSPIAPFSWGKELNQMADTATTLTRARYGGSSSKHLLMHITKARNGMTGRISFEITEGFRIVEIEFERGLSLDMKCEAENSKE